MIIKNSYRLADFRISQYQGGHLRWEAHHGFGLQKSGPCSIMGPALVLEPAENEEIGYLIDEFDAGLKSLPAWNKTAFYCHAENITVLPHGHEARPCLGEYRLNRYLITAGARGIEWTTHQGRDGLARGPAFLEQGILVLNPGTSRSKGSRKAFQDRLGPLPSWRSSRAWCLASSLRPCAAAPVARGRQRDRTPGKAAPPTGSSRLTQPAPPRPRSPKPAAAALVLVLLASGLAASAFVGHDRFEREDHHGQKTHSPHHRRH